MRDGKIHVVIAPAEARANPFAKRFAQSIASPDFEVHNYNYEPALPGSADALILHWPNEFFMEQSPGRSQELRRLLAIWKTAKDDQQLRLIWAVHNLHPHDVQLQVTELARLFLANLDGVIHFSKCSRELVRKFYGCQVPREIVTVHGHYRDDQTKSPRSPPPIDGPIRLGYFGRIRPYKGLTRLIACMDEVVDSEATLTITGKKLNQDYSATIEAMAAQRSQVTTDLREDFLSEADLELSADETHGIVLPYCDILNSGSALFALSRNRPVLTPRLGSLSELQANVGEDWVQLYDGNLTSQTLVSFIRHLRTGLPPFCDLSAYDWPPISQSLRRFIRRVCQPG